VTQTILNIPFAGAVYSPDRQGGYCIKFKSAKAFKVIAKLLKRKP